MSYKVEEQSSTQARRRSYQASLLWRAMWKSRHPLHTSGCPRPADPLCCVYNAIFNLVLIPGGRSDELFRRHTSLSLPDHHPQVEQLLIHCVKGKSKISSPRAILQLSARQSEQRSSDWKAISSGTEFRSSLGFDGIEVRERGS